MPRLHYSWWLGPAVIALILWLVTSSVARGRLRHIYLAHFPESPRERLFLASIGFFVTTAVVRALTWAIHNEIGPFHDIQMGGRHIHHLVWGILLLLLVGYGWLAQVGTGEGRSNPWMGRLLSMVYGVGAALTLDEFALWLNLRDVYWSREGRESYEALSMFGAVLMAGIFGRNFFRGIALEFTKAFRRERKPHHVGKK
jgi:hypothetical protein